MFSEIIHEFHIQNQMPQQQLFAALDIDTATYCKIKKGKSKERKSFCFVKTILCQYWAFINAMVCRPSTCYCLELPQIAPKHSC